jgi:hypothetical protein
MSSSDDDDLVDITQLVEECAISLSVTDPLVCHPHSFRLHDAMAASLLQDSKLDCCEIPIALVAPYGFYSEATAAGSSQTVFPRPTPTGLDGAFAPLKWDALTTADAAFIVLGILVRLQSFLSGASVGESIFTCLYAHSPVLVDMRARLFPDDETTSAAVEMVDNRIPAAALVDKMDQLQIRKGQQYKGSFAQIVVFASALALVETALAVRDVIQNADIYEEEDFVSTNYIPFYTEAADMDSLRADWALSMVLDEILTAESVLEQAIAMMIGFQRDLSTVLATMVSRSLANGLPKLQSYTEPCEHY